MSYTPSSGFGASSWTLLGSVTIANQATVDLNITGDFSLYAIQLTDIIPSTDDTELWMRFSLVGSASFLSGASDYVWRHQGIFRLSGGAGAESDTADSEIQLTRSLAGAKMGSSAGESLNATVYLNNPNQSSNVVTGRADVAQYDAAAAQSWMDVRFSLVNTQSDNVDAVRFLASSGNLNTGNAALYGVK